MWEVESFKEMAHKPSPIHTNTFSHLTYIHCYDIFTYLQIGMLFLFQCVSVMKNDVASDADADADGKIADYSGSILTIR